MNQDSDRKDTEVGPLLIALNWTSISNGPWTNVTSKWYSYVFSIKTNPIMPHWPFATPCQLNLASEYPPSLQGDLSTACLNNCLSANSAALNFNNMVALFFSSCIFSTNHFISVHKRLPRERDLYIHTQKKKKRVHTIITPHLPILLFIPSHHTHHHVVSPRSWPN